MRSTIARSLRKLADLLDPMTNTISIHNCSDPEATTRAIKKALQASKKLAAKRARKARLT